MTDVALDDLDQTPEGAAILDDLETFLRRFVAFPSEHSAVAVTLWAAHAHAVNKFRTTPRLALLSPEPDSGKTRVLEMLELVTPDPQMAVNISTAAMFRLVDSDQPTILLDEVDNIFTHKGKDDDNADLRAILNNGYRKGGQVPRCVGTKNELKRFLVYSALAMAGLGELPETLMRRSIVVRMRRRAAHEYIDDFDYDEHADEGWELRDRLAGWADSAAPARKPPLPDGVRDRDRECWRPLIALADAAGGDWPNRARAVCTAFVHAPSGEREQSLGVRLLTDIHAAFGADEQLSTQALLARLHDLEESPWDDLRGKPLDSRRLARMLGEYEVASADVHETDGVGKRKTRKGYRREDFHDAWGRYVDSALSSPARERQARQARYPSADGEHGGALEDPGAPAAAPDTQSAPAHTPVTSNGVAGAPGAPLREETEAACPVCGQAYAYSRDGERRHPDCRRDCQGCGDPVTTGNEWAARRHVGCPESAGWPADSIGSQENQENAA